MSAPLLALLALLVADGGSARAQGLLEALGARDPWDELERQDAPDRETALATLIRTGGHELCAPLFRVFQSESAQSSLRTSLLHALGRLRCRKLLPYLLRMARQSRPPDDSRAAIRALGLLRDPRALPLLKRLARTGQAPQEAVQALARFGRQGVPTLLALLRRGAPGATAAALALSRARVPQAVPAIRAALASRRLPPEVALRALGSFPSEKTRTLLTASLFHAEPRVRLAALQSLERCADASVAPALLATLTHPALRRRSLRLLAALGERGPVSPLISLIHSQTLPLATLAVRTLGRTGGGSAVRPLAWLALHGKLGLRRVAVAALQHTGDPLAARVLRRLARRAGPLAPSAALALGSLLRPPRGHDAPPKALRRAARAATRDLLALARGRNPMLRAAALQALGSMHAGRALSVLLAALEAPHAAVRRAAAAALGALPDDQAVPALIRALERDSDPVVRAEAALALGRQRSHFAIDPLLNALKNTAFPVAQNAALALGQLGLRSVGPRLARHLSHRNPAVRGNLALALACLRHRGAKARLLRLARRDEVPQVRAVAVSALARIYGARSLPWLQALRRRELEASVSDVIRRACLRLQGRPAPPPVGRTAPWIAFRLEDGRGRAVAWRAFTLRLADGSLLGGVTDADGYGLAESIPVGAVRVQLLGQTLPPHPPTAGALPPGSRRSPHP